MFKKILSLMLVVLMLTLCCACNTGTENGTDDIPTAAPTDSTDDKGSESAAPEINIPEPDVPDGSILISGKNRYKIIYATGGKKLATPLYNELIKKDKLAEGSSKYYTFASDALEDDGSPEILIGATNRELSTKAAAMLTSARDYAILAEGNKIAICAGSEA